MSKYLLFVFLFFLSAPAFADCTSPAGVNSQTRYDFAQHKMLYCNGTNWVAIPSSGGLGCVLDGVVVNDGSSFNFYSAQNHANCTTIRQSRLCTNGVLGGGATYQYAACSALDTTPNAFSFNDVTGAALNTTIDSNVIQISGLTAASPVSISGGLYWRKCSDAPCGTVIQGWSASPGTISDGQYIQLHLKTGADSATAYSMNINIGGVTDNWSVTTGDSVPNAFSFTDVTNAAVNTATTSNIIQISGLTIRAPVTVSNGASVRECSNATCSTNPMWLGSTSVGNNQYLQLRLTSAASLNTAISTDVTVGGVTDNWSVKTIADCTTGPIGSRCTSDGAYYIGTVNGMRIYTNNSNQAASNNWKFTNTITNGTDSLTDGLANTNAMIAAGGHSAAIGCRSMGAQWYLPAKDELNLLWQNSTHNGGVLNLETIIGMYVDVYWSSSQSSATGAWSQQFGSGSQNIYSKTNGMAVRCVRR